MRSPDRPDPDQTNETGERPPRERPLSPEDRRRVLRAALLRPMSLLVVVVGMVFFALTLVWWTIPLTLVTYAALVFLAARDPLFWGYVLEGRPMTMPLPGTSSGRNPSPEQRAGRLPHGETRQTVEAALEARQRTTVAIRESDEETRALLEDVIPKLDHIVGHLIKVAEKRERIAAKVQALKPRANASHHGACNLGLAELQSELSAADTEISDAIKKLLSFRARVVRLSTETGDAAREAADNLNADLDEMALRLLGTLRSIASPPKSTDQ